MANQAGLVAYVNARIGKPGVLSTTFGSSPVFRVAAATFDQLLAVQEGVFQIAVAFALKINRAGKFLARISIHEQPRFGTIAPLCAHCLIVAEFCVADPETCLLYTSD